MQYIIQDMKVASLEYADGFTAEDGTESSDWKQIQNIACYSHNDACEFIVWLGKGKNYEENIKEYAEKGMSADFIAECKKAHDLDFNYVCFYA